MIRIKDVEILSERLQLRKKFAKGLRNTEFCVVNYPSCPNSTIVHSFFFCLGPLSIDICVTTNKRSQLLCLPVDAFTHLKDFRRDPVLDPFSVFLRGGGW